MTFQTRHIRIVGQMQKDTAIAAIQNLPVNGEKPLVVTIGEERKARGLDQNAAMWAGPLKDIAEQAWLSGRQFSAEVWHEHFKREYLPELDHPNLRELVKEDYKKWEFTPSGERICVGSTTKLTRYGFSLYLQQVEAYGASLGVLFHTRETEHA